MKAVVHPSEIHGSLIAPGSKSYAQRAIFAGLLANGTSILEGITWADDTLHALHAALSLGAEIKTYGSTLQITGSQHPRVDHIYAGESGLSSRMLSAILMSYSSRMTLSGSGTLTDRPFDPIFEVYEQLGLTFNSRNGCLPLSIQGPMKKNVDVVLDGQLSSQFASGLLIAFANSKGHSKLQLENITSRPYLDMTLDTLKQFGVQWIEVSDNTFVLSEGSGIKSCRYTIEGDWSGAAFLLVAGLVGGRLSVSNLQTDSLQADRAILNLLGREITWKGQTVNVKKNQIPAFTFDATHCPDLFPPLAALAVFANGQSTIKGVHRLVHKESNRAEALRSEFSKLGIRILIEGDEMYISPGRPTGGNVHAHHDHRMAMALTLLGLNASGEVIIEGAEYVSKSFPSFFSDLQRVGAQIKLIHSSEVQ